VVDFRTGGDSRRRRRRRDSDSEEEGGAGGAVLLLEDLPPAWDWRAIKDLCHAKDPSVRLGPVRRRDLTLKPGRGRKHRPRRRAARRPLPRAVRRPGKAGMYIVCGRARSSRDESWSNVKQKRPKSDQGSASATVFPPGDETHTPHTKNATQNTRCPSTRARTRSRPRSGSTATTRRRSWPRSSGTTRRRRRTGASPNPNRRPSADAASARTRPRSSARRCCCGARCRGKLLGFMPYLRHAGGERRSPIPP